MKGEVKQKLSLDRRAREIAGRPAWFRLHRRIAIANQVRVQLVRRLLTSSLFKEKILAAEAVGTVENLLFGFSTVSTERQLPQLLLELRILEQ